MAGPTKNQHYVPQSYIDRFAVNGKISVFFKKDNRILLNQNSRDSAANRYYYDANRVELETLLRDSVQLIPEFQQLINWDDEQLIEHYFEWSVNPMNCSTRLKRIHRCLTLMQMLLVLPYFYMIWAIATRHIEMVFQKINKCTYQALAKMNLTEDQRLYAERTYGQEQARNQQLHAITDIAPVLQTYQKLFGEYDLYFATAEKDACFIISDDPAFFVRLELPEICFPLSGKHALLFRKPGAIAPIIGTDVPVGKRISISIPNVVRYNLLQFCAASRYVFGDNHNLEQMKLLWEHSNRKSGASMDADKIIQDLNRKFAAPLPEFYRRRIVIWYDEDREFEDQIDGLTLCNAKVLKLTGSNNFLAKKLLAVDNPTSNYLVYCPLSYDTEEDDWLLDVELYSEEFRADQISMWMCEIKKIPETPTLRKAFKQYRKFFKAQGRRNKITAQSSTPAKPVQLQMAIMAALAGIKEAKPNQIMKAVLQAGLDMESNAVWQEFVSYDITGAFWSMAGQGTGYKDADADLRHLAAHLLLTAATRTMRQDAFSGLESLISTPHQAYCFDFVSDWIHSEDSKDIYAIAEYAESELKLPQRFMKLQVVDLLETEMFPCVNEVILVKLMTDIANHSIDVDLITQAVEKRRTCVWYDDVINCWASCRLPRCRRSLRSTLPASIRVGGRVWQEYTRRSLRMDTYYRQFHMRYADSLKSYHIELPDRFSLVKDQVEGLYINWFLGQLGTNWSDASRITCVNIARILEVPQQVDFYKSRVAPSDAKVYVIISDAMRYEVAASLTEQLQRETQAKVSLTGMQGIFPTITKFGMAALLPHKKLSVELKTGKVDRLAVLADGQSTEAGNRDKLLKGADIHSVALKYKDIIGIKRVERQSLIKGMNVVYIYHDTIDAAGHDEKDVFSACAETIEELKNMVRIIANEWGGAYILITSDHGFLYTYSPLTEDDKVNSRRSDQDVEIDRRYAIMQRGAQPPYLSRFGSWAVKRRMTPSRPERTSASRKRAAGSTLCMAASACRKWSCPSSSITSCGTSPANTGRTAASMIPSR